MSLFYDVPQSKRHHKKVFWQAFWDWCGIVIWSGGVCTFLPVAIAMACLVVWDNWAAYRTVFDIEPGQWPDFATIDFPCVWAVLPAALAMALRVWITVVFHKKRNDKEYKEQVTRGNRVADAKEFRSLYIKKHRNDRIVWHGEVPVSLDAMTAGGSVYCGTTGTGKSTLMEQALEQKIDYDVKCLIYDSERTKVERFYREGIDVIVNPFDPRGWYLPLDSFIKDEVSTFTMARALFPEGYSSETKWFNKAGREITQDVLLYLVRQKRVEWEEFFEIMRADTQRLTGVLKRIKDDPASTGAIAHFSDAAGGMRLHSDQNQGNKATLSTYLAGLQNILKSKGNPELHIDRWFFEDNPEGNIFLTSFEDYASELVNLHSLVVNTYGFNVFKRPEGSGRYFSLDLDEFDDLNPLDIVVLLNKKGRKRGNINSFGLQGLSQMDEKYGIAKRKTLMQTINHDFIFTIPDPETAQILSDRLSKKTINRTDISLNLPDHSDEKARAASESFSKREEEKSLVSASDLINLPFHQFYHRAPGMPVTKAGTIKPVNKPVKMRPTKNALIRNLSDNKRATESAE